MELSEIIKYYNIDDIEHALIFSYLKRNKIPVSANHFIENYLNNFKPDSSLMNDIESLKHSSLAELAVDMELLIPESDRETNGAFFTPQYIVDYIINCIHPKRTDRVADISCGCAAFLLGIIRYYKAVYNKTVTEIVQENLFGADILDYNVRRSKILICLMGLSYNEIIDYDSIKVLCTNSLTYKWRTNFDAIVGNPPYVKFQDMSDETRVLLNNLFRTTSSGSYNLYFAFFEKGHSLLSQNGKLGYITPNNYFTSLSGEPLREFFNSARCVEKIVDFNATKVFDVQTYTAITFISKNGHNQIDYARIGANQIPSDFLLHLNFSNNSYAELNVKKWRLLCGEERFAINQMENAGTQIGELMNIAVGIATLKDEVYFIEPVDEDEQYYYCRNKYRAHIQIEKRITKPLVKISTIKTQEDLLLNRRRIIFPYHNGQRIATPYSEEEMHQLFPYCHDYLQSMAEILSQRGKGKHTYTPFYAYGRTQGLNKTGAKIYTPTFSQYPRFILDNDGTSLFTNGYGLFFNEQHFAADELFHEQTNLIGLLENSDVLLKILNSGLMHYYVTKTSVAIEGGYPCYQKNFIERFSIPTLDEEHINELRNLDDKKAIDEYLCELYALHIPQENLWESN